MPKQVGNQNNKKFVGSRPLLAHLSNFVILTFMFVGHKMFRMRLFTPAGLLSPGGSCPLPLVSYATGPRCSQWVMYMLIVCRPRTALMA